MRSGSGLGAVPPTGVARVELISRARRRANVVRVWVFMDFTSLVNGRNSVQRRKIAE